MAKSTTSHENYLKKKTRIEKQSFAKRNKWKSSIGYVSSWFFNLISFILSFIFIKTVMDASFVEFSSNTFLYYLSITLIGLVLIFYELLKRFNVDHFCVDYNDHETDKFSWYFIKDLLITLIIFVAPSIFMSINGSIKIADNFFEVQKISEKTLNIKTDSIANFYFSNYIQLLQSENAILQQQKNEFITQKKTYLIKSNDIQINKNKEAIAAYENERNAKIKELEDKNNTILSKTKKEVDKNIMVFIIISLFIEVVIVVGVWYKRLYDIKLVRDYEEIDMNSPEYKKWKKFTEILNFIYSNSTAKVGGEVETTQTLITLIEMNNLNISKKDLDDCFKLMNFLHICEKEGRRRIIKMDFDKANITIKKHFNIE